MFEIKFPSEKEIPIWTSLDKHINADEVSRIINNKRGYFITTGGMAVGILRYTLLWDNIPFINHIYIKETQRGLGIGKDVITQWEDEMRKAGYKQAMISAPSDEEGQRFLRKIGYKDCGSLILDFHKRRQPAELFFIKKL